MTEVEHNDIEVSPEFAELIALLKDGKMNDAVWAFADMAGEMPPGDYVRAAREVADFVQWFAGIDQKVAEDFEWEAEVHGMMELSNWWVTAFPGMSATLQ